MAKRKIQKPTRFERMYKVWDYLRKNTDRRHPTSIAISFKSLLIVSLSPIYAFIFSSFLILAILVGCLLSVF